MIIAPTSAINIPYTMPLSGIVEIHVHSTKAVSPFATERRYVSRVKLGQCPIAFGLSGLDTKHCFLTAYRAPGTEWNLIIVNDWSDPVEVQYQVIEMVIQRGVR